MPNVNSYTYIHNHKVLNDKPNETWINNWNCRNKDTCSLSNSCQTKCRVYQANIDCDIAGYEQKFYLGSCETTFKDRFRNHKKSFNHVKHKNDTELSKKKIGKSKSAVEHQKSHRSKHCLFCLDEKYEIATYAIRMPRFKL